MNKFIELREAFYEEDNPYIFSLLFLDYYIKTSKTINLNEDIVLEEIRNINRMYLKESLDKDQIYNLLESLGKNKYLDRYIVDIIIKKSKVSQSEILKDIISSIILKNNYTSIELYHLLDISIECHIKTLDDNTMAFLLDRYKKNTEVLSMLIDYLYSFKIDSFKTHLYDILQTENPYTIKLQILELIVYLYSVEELEKFIKKTNSFSNSDRALYKKYMEFLKMEFSFAEEKLILLQSMFYGDFEDSGKGDNGGLAVLLKSLGNEMSKDENVSKVITISINKDFDKEFINSYMENHIFVRLPIYLEEIIKDPFAKRELFIKRAILRFLNRSNISPDIFHIRYLDNASKAVSSLSEELGAKLVFTLTPDPHRNMLDENGEFISFSLQEIITNLNKIRIGDELLYSSHGILGIGSEGVRKELEIYFPQLKEEKIKKKLKMISEGIRTDTSIKDYDIENEIDYLIKSKMIDRSFFDRPIILNVGRLDVLKGQESLLKAWGDSKLSISHNLLIIGGDLENPNREEARIIAFFKEYLQSNPHLKERFCHIPAIANESIRMIEKYIMKRNLDYPNIYLCSSKKEEFGIAILEALLQGFLVFGPKKGGVKTYIETGKNGFLIDTSSSQTIARDSERIIYHSNINKDEFKKIQRSGKETVNELFSIEKIAKEFLEFYLSLKGGN